MIDKNALRLSAQRALLYNVPVGTRTISLEVVGTLLNMRAVVDGPMDADVRDCFYSAAGEIEGDFVELSAGGEVEILQFDAVVQVPLLAVLVFARSDV